MSLLDVNLSFVHLDDPANCLTELFYGLNEAQTLQSLHLCGVGGSVDLEVLTELEKSILGISAEK